MEDAISLMPDRAQTWVRDHKPASAKKAAQLADEYYQNRPSESDQGLRNPNRSSYRHSDSRDSGRYMPSDSKQRHQQKPQNEKSDIAEDKPWLKPKFDPILGPLCFHCNGYGHIASACPQKPEPVGLVLEHPRAAVYGGKIAGNPVKKMLVDTGASRTIVNSQWVPPAARTGVTLPFSPFSGEPRDLHLARVAVTDKEVDLEVKVQDDLKYDALLGLNIPFLWNLGDHLRCKEEALAVQTRAQAKKQDDIEQ